MVALVRVGLKVLDGVASYARAEGDSVRQETTVLPRAHPLYPTIRIKSKER